MFGGFVCRRVVCMYVVSRTSFTWTDEVSKGKWRGSRKNHQQQTLYDSLLLSRKLPHFWPLNELFSLSLSVVMAKSINEIRDCCDILPLGRKRKNINATYFLLRGWECLCVQHSRHILVHSIRLIHILQMTSLGPFSELRCRYLGRFFYIV